MVWHLNRAKCYNVEHVLRCICWDKIAFLNYLYIIFYSMQIYCCNWWYFLDMYHFVEPIKTCLVPWTLHSDIEAYTNIVSNSDIILFVCFNILPELTVPVNYRYFICLINQNQYILFLMFDILFLPFLYKIPVHEYIILINLFDPGYFMNQNNSTAEKIQIGRQKRGP
jgi:hypothetical protein